VHIAIEGIGSIGSFGFGRGALARALANPPAFERMEGLPVLPKADASIVASYVQARALRQLDHYTRMALAAAFAALEDARVAPEEMASAGLVIASGYGPAQMTFSFLDSIEDHGANMASPLSFSFSVHNIPAANIALRLGMADPCTTVCQLESSVTSALLTASAWLAEGRVSRILFGAVDEITPILAAITARITDDAPAHSSHERRDLPLGEGAAFFCLSRNEGKAKAVIREVSLCATPSAVFSEFQADAVYHSGSLYGLQEDARTVGRVRQPPRCPILRHVRRRRRLGDRGGRENSVRVILTGRSRGGRCASFTNAGSSGLFGAVNGKAIF
jgi:3-oxoacyl-[acyl-carrier-protein] synthase II